MGYRFRRNALEKNPHALWYRQATAALSQHRFLKGFGTTLFIGIFFSAYFYLLKAPAYLTTVMPITPLDHFINFQPQAMTVYLSLWVYVSLPPALLATRRELFRYGVAMAVTCLTAMLIFYFWPTAVPAAPIDWSQHSYMNFLKNIDAAGNAFPSLHVATAIFSGIWLHYLLRRFRAPYWVLSLNGVWCMGIIYSTIATRQHVAVDVLGGLVLGMWAAYLSLRQHARADIDGNGHTPAI